MTHERKPPKETWEDFTEREIRTAQADGAFENLPGFGKPIPGIDQAYDENWWIKEKLKRERMQVVPPILEARLALEQTLKEIALTDNEFVVRKKLSEVNEKLRKAHYSPIAGPTDGIAEVDIEAAVIEWKESRSS